MPTLQQLTDQPGADPPLVVDQASTNQIEPLAGPVSIDDLMDRFPDTVYDQSRDTHLFKFISALCGDSGAGLLKKQTFLARLRNEGDLLTFRDLDTFYVQHLRFPRLRSEMYPTLDPSTDILTKSEWDEIQRCDLLYYHRVQLFMHSTRLGSTPQGMQLAAEAGSGVHCDVI